MGDPNLEFMLEPDLWPRWPYLPIRKRNPAGPFPFHGTLVQTSEGKFEFIQVDDGSKISRGGLELIQQLFDEGWIVD